MQAIYWFRRDRRVSDNEALHFASEHELLPVFIHSGFENQSANRQHSLLASLQSLDGLLQQKLNVTSGDASEEILQLAIKHGIDLVIATRAYDTEGMIEQANVAEALHKNSITLKLVGSYYAITPGEVNKPDGTPYKVYTPFWRAWSDKEIPKPFPTPQLRLIEPVIRDFPKVRDEASIRIKAGEEYALQTLSRFKKIVENYPEDRDQMAVSGTSKLSHALAHGEIHPRTVIAAIGFENEVFIKEICWREFYADVMFRNPHTLDEYFDTRFENMQYDTGQQADERFEAWKSGKTGYPVVDAAMRQLRETGWMHNRARMITASFLIKDLHLEWQQGASWFESQLTDFDPASNSHGWQWTAGCGTDASPYFRVFNPILQGKKFDPEGEYIKRYVPELAHLDKKSIHEPWDAIDGYQHNYPERIVDHATERQETLARFQALKNN